MNSIFYAIERLFLENYLKEKASFSAEDLKAASALWTDSIPNPGSDAAEAQAGGEELPPQFAIWGPPEKFMLSNSPHGERNNPAQAGKTKEGQMNLSEFLSENPAAAAEIDRLQREAKEAGAAEAKADLAARVGKVLPIIQSAAYPANIKTIACNVLSGGEEMAAFTAAVAVFDSQKESSASADAQKQTAELGAVGAEPPASGNAEQKAVDDAWAASIAAASARRAGAAQGARA